MNEFDYLGIKNQNLSDPFTEGLFLVGVTNEQIDFWGLFLNDFYQKIRHKYERQVTRNALTMLKGAIFAIGTKEKNPEWKEHCASSLREIFHEWSNINNGGLESDFVYFYKDKGNKKLTDGEKGIFKRFKLHYQYFSGIDHHNASTIMDSLQNLLNNQSLKLEDCYKNEIFIERVKEFFSILNKIISFSNYKHI